MTRGTPAHALLRSRLTTVALMTVVTALIGSTLVYLFEHGRADIHTFGDALFWTTAQLLTVSSQMKNPISTGGRIVDIVLEFYAITVVTTVAGSWADFFHHRRHERGQIPERAR